jgi:hypothetical protein
VTCKACGAAASLKTCLFCGHGACPSHRAEVDGATACTTCYEAEQARKKRVSESAKLLAAGSGRQPVGSPIAPGVDAPAKPLAPLPEPGGGGLLATAVAGAATLAAVLYLQWLHRRLELDPDVVPDWAGTSGIAFGGAFVFCGVWVIVKSRVAR